MERRSTRRQTLGSVSVNSQSGDRRKSVGPSNGRVPNGAVKARPPRGRVSMIPRVGRENAVPPTPPASGTKGRSRRSSGVSGDRRKSVVPPVAPAKTDPRPITDKAFQQECIKKLLEFLASRGYEHPISHRSLARPSGKDFNNIVTFLLRLVDTNFQDGSMKMEDEVAMNFKAIGYPFPVSKTALVAAGSPHTWPSLLAALAWLMERIQCLENCVSNEDEDPGHFDSLEELENKTDKAFFMYLSKAYTAFLRGDEQLTEQLTFELAERFERDDSIIEQEIEQMTDKNAVILERINNFSMGEKDLESYTQKREGYSTDLEQFHDLIQQMDQHVSTLSQKKNDRAQELEDTNRKFARTNSRVVELKDAISSQALSFDDVQKMQNELKGIEEAINRANVSKEDHRQLLWNSQSEIESLLRELESLVDLYNLQVNELTLLPIIPEENALATLTIESEAMAESDQTKLLGADLQQSVQYSIQRCKQDYASNIADAKRNYQESLDQAERSEEGFAEVLDRLKIIEGRIEKNEETIVAERGAQDAKLEVRLREAASMEAKIASVRDPVALEEQMAQYERQCAELEALRMKHEQENIMRRKTAFTEVARACDAIVAYEEFFQNKIVEVERYRLEKQAAFDKIQPPNIL